MSNHTRPVQTIHAALFLHYTVQRIFFARPPWRPCCSFAWPCSAARRGMLGKSSCIRLQMKLLLQQGLYVCFGVAGNGAYVILWHASLPEISSSLCSNSSPAHPSRRVRVCPGTPRVQSFDLFCQGSQDLSRPRPIRDPGYIAMSAGSSRCLLTQSGVESCSPSDCSQSFLTNALKPRCEIMSSVRDRVMDDQR